MSEEKNESIMENLSPHSVKLSMNAKGLISGEVKCYAETPEEALSKATKILKDMEVMIREKNGI